MSTPPSVLHLYRRILKEAKVFPSIKRNAIIEEIRLEFRINSSETDSEKIKQQIKVAVRSLEQMESLTKLDKGSLDWSVNLKGACD